MTNNKQKSSDIFLTIFIIGLFIGLILFFLILWYDKVTNDLVPDNCKTGLCDFSYHNGSDLILDMRCCDDLINNNETNFDASSNYTGNLSITSNMNRTFGLYVSQPTEWIATFSEDYYNVTINGNICQEVICECAKKNPACMSICYYCKEKNNDK